MTEIFADTFYFIAILSASDEAYQRTRAITANQQAKLITTAWVLTELANTFCRHDVRSGFVDTLRALRSDPSVVIVGPDPRWFEAGLELYSSRPDKDWSLRDCISFAVMHDRGIAEALTGDHHFEQAGFRAILK
ncbi:MAG TPA: PIN domain-containing protein [Tepidisphaeraceae bacterium]|jgi:hypothetical protein|nr:PIN domain-containing protein [Tepidisphaeraceae bacterium]